MAEKTIRVAILADYPLASLDSGALGRGGGQGCTWLPQLALHFDSIRDLDVHWIVLDRQERRAETRQAHGQTFHRIPGVKFSLDLALSYWPARIAIRRILKQIRPDLIHAWGTERIYPAALLDFPGPGILSMQGILSEYARIGGLPSDWRWRRMIRSERIFMQAATIVTSESLWGMDRVAEVVPDVQLRMVEYGVHPSFYDIPWQPAVEEPYAIYVGGTDYRKGFDLLLEAMKQLPDRQWELRVAGDDRMEEIVADADLLGVRCLGLLPWDRMQQELSGAWCSVLPTRCDTSANSVKEARVIGLPVVASKHGGHAGYIRDGQNGRIVEPLNATTLAQAMSDVMVSLERARQLGRTRHAEDRAYLHPSRTAEGFAEIYRELSSATR
jgi:glycosyltransferase involved in cell wall biosynthesis